MIRKAAGWVNGVVGFIAGVIAIVTYVRQEPVRAIDMELHPADWLLLAGVCFGVLAAVATHPIAERRRRIRLARSSRFERLLPRVKGIRKLVLQRPSRSARAAPIRNVEIGLIIADTQAALAALGVDFPFRELGEYPVFIDMLERGALREAQRRFPAPRAERPVFRLFRWLRRSG